MEDSWELVSVPTEIQHSMAGKETPLDGSETSLERNDGNNKSKVLKFAANSLTRAPSMYMRVILLYALFPAKLMYTE